MRRIGDPAHAEYVVDLKNQTVSSRETGVFEFKIDTFHKECLVEGLDEISLTLKKSQAIHDFEKNQKIAQPWLY